MTINDMNTLLAALEIAVKRGAFSVLEVGAVGEVSTKLANFLQSAKEQAEKAAAEQTSVEQEQGSEQQTDTASAETTGA